jgi:hypothetical protein
MRPTRVGHEQPARHELAVAVLKRHALGDPARGEHVGRHREHEACQRRVPELDLREQPDAVANNDGHYLALVDDRIHAL